MAARPTDLTALAKRAEAALGEGNLDISAELYRALEAAEPRNPEWPRYLATIHRRRDEPARELDALLRCAERHAARGESLPALATCKMVLSIDPSHAAGEELLMRLQPDRAVSVDYSDASYPARPTVPVQPANRTDGANAARARPADDGARRSSPALDELVLIDIIEGARPASLTEAPLEGVHEIPLSDAGSGAPGRKRKRRRAAKTRAGAAPEVAITSQLEHCPLFQSLGNDALSKLVRQVQVVELAGAEELFHQGDPAGALYVVAHGAVVPIAEEEPRTRLAVLEQGEFFGEMALFTDQPRNATVEALVDTQLLEIDRKTMWSLVREHPEVLSVLLGFLRERLIDRLVRTSPLFRIFSSTKREALVRRFRFLEVADGRRVVEQHAPAEAVFILLSGRMEVVHEAGRDAGDPGSEKVLATLGPGALFGEMALLWREPSLASVVARGKCWLLALSAQSFKQMLEHHPQLAAMAAQIAEERREQNQRTLRDALGHRDGKAGLI